jgi:hypothetical protein
MFDLPLATKAWMINTYCFSKIVFLDPYHPATESQINELMTSALNKIRDNKRTLPGLNKLCRSKTNGGFGLWDLKEKLLGSRAKRIYKIYLRTSFFSKFVLLTMQQTFFNTLSSMVFSFQAIFYPKHQRMVFDLTLPLPSLNIAKAAWLELVKAPPQTQESPSNNPAYNPNTIQTLAHRLTDMKDQPLSLLTFSRTWHAKEAIRGTLGPIWDFPEETNLQWASAWEGLNILRRWNPMPAQTLHLMLLKNLPCYGKYGQEWLESRPRMLYKSPNCPLCRQQLDNHEHAFFTCPIIQQLWNLIPTSSPNTYFGLQKLLNIIPRHEGQTATNIVASIHSIRTAYRYHIQTDAPNLEANIMKEYTKSKIPPADNPGAYYEYWNWWRGRHHRNRGQQPPLHV